MASHPSPTWLADTTQAILGNWAPFRRQAGIEPSQPLDASGVVVPVVAATAGGPIPTSADLVLAQTCIDHCKGDPDRLAGTVLADLVFGHAVAVELGAQLVCIVGTGEETQIVPNGLGRAAQWRRVGDAIDDLWCSFVDPPAGRRLVRTDDADVWAAATAQVAADARAVADADLDGLYRVDPADRFPAGTPYRYFYAYYRHNVARYRRSLLAELLDRPVGSVVVVEDVIQARAVALARQLDPEPSATSHLATLPAPARDGRTRASRSSGSAWISLDEVRRGRGCLAALGPYWALVDAAWEAASASPRRRLRARA